MTDDLINIRTGFNENSTAFFDKCDAGNIFTVNAVNEEINRGILKCLVDHKTKRLGADAASTLFFAQFNMDLRSGRSVIRKRDIADIVLFIEKRERTNLPMHSGKYSLHNLKGILHFFCLRELLTKLGKLQ